MGQPCYRNWSRSLRVAKRHGDAGRHIPATAAKGGGTATIKRVSGGNLGKGCSDGSGRSGCGEGCEKGAERTGFRCRQPLSTGVIAFSSFGRSDLVMLCMKNASSDVATPQHHHDHIANSSAWQQFAAVRGLGIVGFSAFLLCLPSFNASHDWPLVRLLPNWDAPSTRIH